MGKAQIVIKPVKTLNKISMKKKITKFTDHLDSQYGPKGTKTRETYDRGFEAFKLDEEKQSSRN
jgi:hypothetical protein